VRAFPGDPGDFLSGPTDPGRTFIGFSKCIAMNFNILARFNPLFSNSVFTVCEI